MSELVHDPPKQYPWKRRVFLAALFVGSIGLFGTGVVAWCFVFGQNLSVVHASDGVLIGVMWSGEYGRCPCALAITRPTAKGLRARMWCHGT